MTEDPVHTRKQLQLLLAASLGKRKSPERVKQLQTELLFWVCSDVEYLHLSPAAISGVSPGGWGREADSPTSQSSSGAVLEMPKPCAKIPAMLWLLPRTHMAQTTRTKKTPLEQSTTELQNPHLWALPAKGQRHQIFPAIPAAGRAGSTVQFVSVVHSIGCCQQEREELGGEQRNHSRGTVN